MVSKVASIVLLVVACSFLNCKSSVVINDKLVDFRSQRVNVLNFEYIGIKIPIKKNNVIVHIAEPVDDLASYQKLLVEKLDISHMKPKAVKPTNKGRTVTLTKSNGEKWVFISVLNIIDYDAMRAMFEHEKYHALAAVSPEDISLLSDRFKYHGFDVDLSSYDEELSATLVETLSYHLMGVPLKDITGREQILKSKDILIANRQKNSLPVITNQDINVLKIKNETIDMNLEPFVPIVNCIINGQEAKLMLDTNSTVVCLFENKTYRFDVSIMGRSGRCKTEEGVTISRKICSELIIDLTKDTRIQVKYAHVLSSVPYDVDGVISAPFLKAINARIDFGTGELIIGKLDKDSSLKDK